MPHNRHTAEPGACWWLSLALQRNKPEMRLFVLLSSLDPMVWYSHRQTFAGTSMPCISG